MDTSKNHIQKWKKTDQNSKIAKNNEHKHALFWSADRLQPLQCSEMLPKHFSRVFPSTYQQLLRCFFTKLRSLQLTNREKARGEITTGDLVSNVFKCTYKMVQGVKIVLVYFFARIGTRGLSLFQQFWTTRPANIYGLEEYKQTSTWNEMHTV